MRYQQELNKLRERISQMLPQSSEEVALRYRESIARELKTVVKADIDEINVGFDHYTIKPLFTYKYRETVETADAFFGDPIPREPEKSIEQPVPVSVPPEPSTIIKPPGAQVMRIARFLFSKEALSEVFVPAYNDFWHEYAEAKVKEENWKARWIRLRYYWAFAKTSGLLKAFEWAWDRVKGLLEIIPPPA